MVFETIASAVGLSGPRQERLADSVRDPDRWCHSLAIDYSFLMRGLLRALVGQERAIENARSACTALSRQRVEREEVELFLARHAIRTRRSA
jgi:hypothetical protein